jgi:formylglycine-generating enzyme required for sulfatase activity
VATYPDHTDVPKSGIEKGRQVLICGGSFTSRASDCWASWRWVIDGDGALPIVGFRCVMDDAEYRKRRK